MRGDTDPTDAFLYWFSTIPDAHQREIEFYYLISTQGLESFGEWKTIAEHLRIPPRSALETIARLGGLRTLIDSIFVPRGTYEEWAELQATLLMASARFKAKGEEKYSNIARRILHEVPAKADDWDTTLISWDDLRKGALSDISLKKWFVNNGSKFV